LSERGPFAAAALDLAARGLAVIPLGGESGKKPLVAWAKWRRPAGKNFLQKLTDKHGAANVGMICGLSKLTVVDVDAAGLADQMMERFGSTPLVVETPSGGRHLYYKSAGERSTDLRSEGFPVDIKAAGGVLVVPPSVRPSGPHAGKSYRFLAGNWDDLPRLPNIRPGSLPASRRKLVPGGAGAVSEGNRNATLLRFLLSQARGCDAITDLQDVAAGWNDLLDSPLPAGEVENTVKSAWTYQINGRNWSGQEARAVVTASEFGILIQNADAFTLRTLLEFNHAARQAPFAVSPKAMHSANHIPGWSLPRYRAARDWLIGKNFLQMVHRGGARQGDPSLFLLPKPRAGMGSEMEPNIIEQPSPLVMPVRHSGRGRQNRADDWQLDLVVMAGGDPPHRRIDAKIFAERLRKARQAVGMTQAEAAERIGISRAGLANIETARYPAGSGLQKRIETIFWSVAA
jgi:DNA-binding XRE family transcriptional regulator